MRYGSGFVGVGVGFEISVLEGSKLILDFIEAREYFLLLFYHTLINIIYVLYIFT